MNTPALLRLFSNPMEVPAGTQALTASVEVRINSLPMGQAPALAAQAAARRPSIQPKGITVSGEVKDYTPVTDAMLRDPNPNDWLMIRHDYHASNYSPLNQITRDNVKRSEEHTSELQSQ